jgi:hypothetical protein
MGVQAVPLHETFHPNLLRWKPLADARDAKVRSSDLFCEGRPRTSQEGQQQHRVVANPVAPVASCFKKAFHLGLCEEILLPRVDGGIRTDNCSHHQHVSPS